MTITPQTEAVGGVLSDGTAVDVKSLAIFDEFEFQGSRGNVEISSADALIENYQVTKDSFVARLTAIDKAGKVQPLMDIYAVNDHVKIVGTATIPSGTAQKAFTVYGTIDTIATGWRGGPNGTTIVIRPCGIKPTWAA
jgi:hypothetical protein